MKFLLTGDWHLTAKSPENRLDDYWNTIQDKVNEVFQIANDHNVKAILQPGDLFDSAYVSYGVSGYLGSRISNFSGDFISVPGQHDLRFHNSDNHNTPFHMLWKSSLIDIPFVEYPEENIAIYGAGWGESVPAIKDGRCLNILLTHRMIIRDEKGKLWEGQEEYDVADKLLQRSGFDLIVSGDNHQSFLSKTKKGMLVNCGSLLRSTISQKDHKPVVYIFNTINCIAKKIELTTEPFDHVMDLEKRERSEKRDEKLNHFIEQLQSTDTADVNYKDNVWKLIKETEKAGEPVSDGVMNIIEHILG